MGNWIDRLGEDTKNRDRERDEDSRRYDEELRENANKYFND